jgi:hypothetical protein
MYQGTLQLVSCPPPAQLFGPVGQMCIRGRFPIRPESDSFSIWKNTIESPYHILNDSNDCRGGLVCLIEARRNMCYRLFDGTCSHCGTWAIEDQHRRHLETGLTHWKLYSPMPTCSQRIKSSRKHSYDFSRFSLYRQRQL